MITADDIADLARNLVSQTSNEVRIRCGISRAYYATFHFCKMAANRWCNAIPQTEKKKGRSHDQLFLQLKNHSKDTSKTKDLQVIAEEAKKLRDLRVDADYELSATIDQRTFARSIHHMSTVKRYFDSL